MVSTRSQSHLSDSSLQTGQEGDVHAGEVNSSEAGRGSHRMRTGRQPPASLAPIAEELPARQTRRRRASKVAEAAEEEEEAASPSGDALVDKLADDIFAALESAFGSGDDASSSSAEDDSSDEEEDEDNPSARNLQWRPDLRLPGQESGGRSGAGARKDIDTNTINRRKALTAEDLLEEKTGGMAKMHAVPLPDKRAADRASRKTAPDTAGKNWFHLPATAITEEVKADLRVLRLRSALDPKKFYKKFDSTKFPKHFQFGTVVEGAADFYSGRLTKKERKRTLAEEVMADDHLTHVRKKRFGRMQEESSKWSTKSKGRKTNNARLKKKPHRPKH